MTTEKQILANRQNAKQSTGPKTESGKRRSRQNAFRHGLTAETVIAVLENSADYDVLAAAINADYRPRTNFELELVARLVSLLWRLRRAVAIESGLIGMEAAALRTRAKKQNESASASAVGRLYAMVPTLVPKITPVLAIDNKSSNETGLRQRNDIAIAFMRLSDRSDIFERLGRYETRLWRQTIQIILLLNSINSDATWNDKSVHFRTRQGKPRQRVSWPPFAIPD